MRDVEIDVDGYRTDRIALFGRHLASLKPAVEAESADEDAGATDVAA